MKVQVFGWGDEDVDTFGTSVYDGGDGVGTNTPTEESYPYN
eukprot:CAMPEP_0113662268 /NCGR_PEP_ID=MMETSP0038_2-20120614/474_1 /TAXON_ID=2898 /ORGANISM="Cryptomonas paramecium" /LENGTH=40 /DNA_ID=CAMNT_0000577129 /DNA_START=104 /DNA_END=226 /DNA_ORIENTATION=+ /assembly_acc=CAM_ASM_000170